MADGYWWLPSLTTAGVLGAIAWLAREWIGARLTKTIQHEFDQKLEQLRSDLRESEEKLKARIREKEGEIAALRSGALSALASRHAALDKRRLEAIDQIWTAFRVLEPARSLATSMGFIKFESAAELVANDPRARQFFEMLGGSFDPSKLDLSAADMARPYLTPMVWAVFSAIRSVAMHTAMRWMVLKGALGKQDYADSDAIRALVVKVLPHYEDYLKEHGPSVYYIVLQALEARLLEELRTMMSGVETDRASLEQAAEIVKAANELQRSTLEEASKA
ncbi:hypothetical protein [Rubrivivax albus]|uniref:Uncharacterized protein n=1 Tax=Rubrivivax albus TaxID=2499835 RepID=A0A3S2TPW4_9BURK|nr:hypothetical protein [Rubrivivax albus]RVT53976.1 hypothetical protein ENE75_03610 [Rubrivivax albus]